MVHSHLRLCELTHELKGSIIGCIPIFTIAWNENSCNSLRLINRRFEWTFSPIPIFSTNKIFKCVFCSIDPYSVWHTLRFKPVYYGAIHKAAGQQLEPPPGPFQPPAPFTAYGSFRNFTRQNHGTAGNRTAGGFVNSAVNNSLDCALR